MTRWSRRTAWPREPSTLTRLLEGVDRATFVDLTESNPTRCGFADLARVALLGDPRGATYVPEALGSAHARQAVSRYYGRRGYDVDASRIVITASTSEAYAWLFKLLADPGDAVLAPRPSYPLFPFLAELESVRLVEYPLVRADGFRIDRPALEAAIDERTRALLVVNPANPTGSWAHQDVVEVALEHDLALIVDEVFADYPHGDAPTKSFVDCDVRCFTLSGLSKVALMPQAKLSWIIVGDHDSSDTAEALARLELIADSYLSVSSAVQLAAPAILDAVDPLQARLCDRLRQNLAALDAATSAEECPVRRVASDAGWYALVEVPRVRTDDEWLALLIERERIIVHPGYFFDMSEAGTMVVSLLCEPAVFSEAIARCVALWSAV